MDLDCEFLRDGPDQADSTVVLAHGAGAPMDSAFMAQLAAGISGDGVSVVRFEFDYMADLRTSGRRRPPDRLPILRRRWTEVCRRLGGAGNLIIGGKSMGGRIASMVADELGARGLICFGYPFHPPGKPDRTRVAHLADLVTPALILQGTRDALGRKEEIDGYELSPAIRVVFIEGGDHSYKPRIRSGRNEDQNLNEAISAARAFVAELQPGKT